MLCSNIIWRSKWLIIYGIITMFLLGKWWWNSFSRWSTLVSKTYRVWKTGSGFNQSTQRRWNWSTDQLIGFNPTNRVTKQLILWIPRSGFFGVSSFDHFDCFIEIRSTNTIIPKVEIPKVKANTVNALSWEPQKTFANHPATNPRKKLTGITIIHAHQINHFGFIRISIRCFSQ